MGEVTVGQPSMEEIEDALREVFRAYDIDESGAIDTYEFIKLETRINIDHGFLVRAGENLARLTLTDHDGNGTLEFDEYRQKQLQVMFEHELSRAEMLNYLKDRVNTCLQERVKMGPRYHEEIRKTLKRIFQLYDTCGDGVLNPEEWITAQKCVATEITGDIDESWIDEAAFRNADKDGDGLLSLNEFLEASFVMFEDLQVKADDILETLKRVVVAMERARLAEREKTADLTIWLQESEKPEFKPPSQAWQDEPTPDDPEKNLESWVDSAFIKLPTDLTSVEQVKAALRLSLKFPGDTWLSVYYMDAPGEDSTVPKVTLLTDSNIQSGLQYLTKSDTIPFLFVKNRRKMPSKLRRTQQALLDMRDELMSSHTGVSWGLDWETQLVGTGASVPRPLVIAPGDALLIEVPLTDDGAEFQYVSQVYMSSCDVLSQPVDQEAAPGKAKKKKKNAVVKADDTLLQLMFIGKQEGACVVFVDVSWEEQEDALAARECILRPCRVNSVARIGPVEVEVKKAPPPTGKDAKAVVEPLPLQWWNGEKWSAKKGPAKKKGKK